MQTWAVGSGWMDGWMEAVSVFLGRPFQAVVATKNDRVRRPEKDVLLFFMAPWAESQSGGNRTLTSSG